MHLHATSLKVEALKFISQRLQANGAFPLTNPEKRTLVLQWDPARRALSTARSAVSQTAQQCMFSNSNPLEAETTSLMEGST